MPNTIVSGVFCEIKYIRRDRLRMNIWANFSEPIHDAWIHFVFYYRYNPTKYEKWAIDLWENLCDFLSGKKSGHLMDWTFGNFLRNTNSNVVHSCPYNGQVYFRNDNISMSNFSNSIQQLFPSGRYRVEANFTDGNKKNVLIKVLFFFSISVHRIEEF